MEKEARGGNLQQQQQQQQQLEGGSYSSYQSATPTSAASPPGPPHSSPSIEDELSWLSPASRLDFFANGLDSEARKSYRKHMSSQERVFFFSTDLSTEDREELLRDINQLVFTDDDDDDDDEVDEEEDEHTEEEVAGGAGPPDRMHSVFEQLQRNEHNLKPLQARKKVATKLLSASSGQEAGLFGKIL